MLLCETIRVHGTHGMTSQITPKSPNATGGGAAPRDQGPWGGCSVPSHQALGLEEDAKGFKNPFAV